MIRFSFGKLFITYSCKCFLRINLNAISIPVNAFLIHSNAFRMHPNAGSFHKVTIINELKMP
uniref:Uncharacterized protein n=1 Tax=Escherichia coli TaxID=562 RepID=A0A336U489_ECOLX|nr:hypothetical protein pHNSHP45-2-orf00293 [Escherichia coli]QIQ13346.1 Hypothetical protein [Salmonella enterica]UIX50891.1 hypothetical protein [Escherichia coli O23:H4]UMW97113.1 hypothetical protein [Salmonella enterica subsp. enterica serovar Typhimurium]ANR95152.1 hypothetical protein plasmid_0103 [Escherichia coli]